MQGTIYGNVSLSEVGTDLTGRADKTKTASFRCFGPWHHAFPWKHGMHDLSALTSDESDIKKNPALQDSPPAAGRVSDIFLSAAVRSRGAFLCHRTKFPVTQKQECRNGTPNLGLLFSILLFPASFPDTGELLLITPLPIEAVPQLLHGIQQRNHHNHRSLFFWSRASR